jgi:uncharacterized protein YjbI with pentapeptide repeats
MLVKNTTPFFAGTVVTARKPPTPEMVLVVRGTFRLVDGAPVEVVEDLEQGMLTGETFAEEDDGRLGQVLAPNDFADFKLNAEVMLVGQCHPPKAPVERCTVSLRLGDWSKDLVVYGDRDWGSWVAGGAPAEPTPFDTMPLDYCHAFGGPELPENPVGKGHGDDPQAPNVELVADTMMAKEQRRLPASFAPLNPGWPQRASYQGRRYDAEWRRTRAPFHAEDHDWRYFHGAPADQQLQGYLRGDEELVLTHLVPGVPVMRSRLPGLRLRAFVKDETGAVRAMPMSLDTVFCEPDEGTVKLTWRGLIEVDDDDLDDVTHIYLASEALSDEPLPEAHYHQALAAFEADPTGVLGALPEAMTEQWAREQKGRRGEPVPPLEVDPALDPVSAKVKNAFGGMISDDKLGQVSTQIDQAKKQAADQEKGGEFEEKLEQVAASIPGPGQAPQSMRARKPGRIPDTGLRKKMRQVLATAEEVRAHIAEARQQAPEADFASAEDKLAELDALPHKPEWKQLDPDYEPPLEPLSDDEPGPGANLSEREFTEVDWSGLDLRGANLQRADLVRANLRGANLEQADLRWATLYQTDLADANLRGAKLSLANAAYLRALGADFTGAVLDEACFEGAQLEGARLDGVSASYVIFEAANLRDVHAEGANFGHCDFSKADLSNAKLVGADFELALFEECEAEGANFEKANLRQAAFTAANFKGVRFVEASIEKGFFERAKLDGADFGRANLTEAHLTKASAKGARFYGCDLRRARLYRTNLERAELVAANLTGAELRKAVIEKARFIDSELYDAKLLDLRGSGADFTGASLQDAVTKEA